MPHIPYLEGSGKLTTLVVDGKPFHARSGEIHNSSASSLEYMDSHVWPALRGMHLNGDEQYMHVFGKQATLYRFNFCPFT